MTTWFRSYPLLAHLHMFVGPARFVCLVCATFRTDRWIDLLRPRPRRRQRQIRRESLSDGIPKVLRGIVVHTPFFYPPVLTCCREHTLGVGKETNYLWFSIPDSSLRFIGTYVEVCRCLQKNTYNTQGSTSSVGILEPRAGRCCSCARRGRRSIHSWVCALAVVAFVWCGFGSAARLLLLPARFPPSPLGGRPNLDRVSSFGPLLLLYLAYFFFCECSSSSSAYSTSPWPGWRRRVSRRLVLCSMCAALVLGYTVILQCIFGTEHIDNGLCVDCLDCVVDCIASLAYPLFYKPICVVACLVT